jgi:hypothetical protein
LNLIPRFIDNGPSTVGEYNVNGWTMQYMHCVTGAIPTHLQLNPGFYTWYLPMSALYTGICFH